MIRAGDPAPSITCVEVLQPSGATWPPPGLADQAIVIFIWLAENELPSMRLFEIWNKAVHDCAHKPVQFVFVTKRAEASLRGWLPDHPVKGWLLHDPDATTARAFGMEMEGFVFVDRGHRVAGFDRGWTPNVFKIDAMLAGRTASFDVEPFRQHRKPDVAPSNEVYVSPTRKPEHNRHAAYLDDHYMNEGVRVKEYLAELYEVHESRIELAAPLDHEARFDFVLVPPQHETPDMMRRMMRAGIERHFNIRVVRELRPMDVYVMTAPNGSIGAKAEGGGGGVMVASFFETVEDVSVDPTTDAAVIDAVKSLEAAGGSDDQRRARFLAMFEALKGRARGQAVPTGNMSISGSTTSEQLSHTLEGLLGRLVVDATGASRFSSFDVNIQSAGGADGLLAALRDQLGVVVTADRREIEILVIKPV